MPQRPIQSLILPTAIILFFGREDAGVPDEVHALFGDHQFRIPMIPNEEARCFNLATSVGIVLMEAERQLGYPGLQ